MKATKKAIRVVAALALAVGLASAASAEVTTRKLDNGFTYITGGDDEPQPGVWDGRYQKVLDKATAEGIPVVVFLAKEGCARCNRLELELACGNPEDWATHDTWGDWPDYPSWIKKRGYLLLFGMYGKGDGNKVLSLIKSGKALPQVSVWWDKTGDGKTDVNTKNETWTGKGNQYVSVLMAKSDAVVNKNGGYSTVPEYAGGTFDFEETEYDRLECEAGTKEVSFTLTRGEKESEYASEALLVAKGPDGDGVDRQTISWEEGESSKTVTVNISGANFTEDGQQATIILTDTNGVERATNHVTYVVKENSPENPLWIGERASPKGGAKLRAAVDIDSAHDLEFGEWTMDLAAAKALAASTEGDAFTLVSIAGSLWCPDCANTEKNFLDAKDARGNNRFSEWAKENNVALAAIDVRRFDTNSVETTANRGNSTLLSRTAGSNGKSGRGYLTRKGVSDEEAAAILERNRQLVTTMTASGGFHRPEDANAYRTGVPYFVMLRKDGTVAARFTRYAKSGASASDKWDDVIKRFDEMLAIAGPNGSAHADAAEIENNHAASTEQVIVANGGEAKGEISCTDLRDAYILDKFSGNATIALNVIGESDAQVELSLWQVKDGEAAMITGAFSTGKLSAGVTLKHTFADAGTYAVQVAAKNRDPDAELDAEFSHLSETAMNFTAYTLTSRAIYTPGPAPGAASAPEGSKKVNIQLEADVLYKLDGLDAESEVNAAALEPVEGAAGFYTAKQSGILALDAATEGGEVAYQKWEPGAVGFEPDAVTQDTEVTVSESTNLLVGVRRVTGVSGEVTVKIALNKKETDFYYDLFAVGVEDNKTLPRFKVDGELGFTEKEITWADGQPLEECVDSLLVQAADSEYGLISQYFGPGKVVFDFTIVAQTEAGDMTNVVDNGKFTINFTEDQKPEAGTVAILDVVNDDGDGWVSKQTIYARENGTATLTLGRLEASQGRVRAELTPSVKGVVFGGDYDIIGVQWENHDDADKKVVVTNLPAAGKSVTLTLKASALSPELKVLKGSNVVTIVSIAADAPSFTASLFEGTVYRFASVANVCPVVCEEDDVMSYTKVSGALPAGLKASVDPATKGLLISGVPTGNDGVGKEYTAVFQAVATRGRAKVKGLTTVVSITVKDPVAKGTGADGEALNDAFAKTQKFGDVMVFKTAEDGQSAELAGMLTGLSIPAKGNASAKFICADGKISLSAKSWTDIDDSGDPETNENYGQLKVTLSGKGGYSLDVEANRDGTVSAVLSAGDEMYEKLVFEDSAWSSKNPAKDCVGYYTVTLPVVENPDTTPAIVENRKGVASRAAAYLTFTMNASQANSGTMKWAGMLPNGEKVSGSSVLATLGDEANVYLPYWSFKAKDKFAGVAKILRGAKDLSTEFDGDDDSCYETVFAPELDFGDGLIPVRTVWRHSENSKATTDGDYEVAYDVYGGIYDSSLGLDCCCLDGRGTDEMTFAIEMPAAPSDVYGEFDAVAPLRVKVGEKSISLINGGGEQKATLKFDAKTGVVSGKFNLSYTDGAGKAKTVSASYNGVVQLGFGDSCGCATNPQPFVNGFWVFGDKLSYPNAAGRNATINVKRGASAIIDVLLY